jgi:peptide deformylase
MFERRQWNGGGGMIREVLRMGDPRLLQQAQPLERFDTPELRALLTDMRDTMAHLSGAGLAAPQIGVDLQVVIFGVAQNPRYPQADELEEDWEGCLSLPGLRGMVPRHARLRYHGFDERGNPIDRSVSGFHARVVQHECDHLMGILYPMRIRDFSKFGFIQALFPGEDIIDE